MYKERIISVLKDVERPGIDSLLHFLNTSDFFEAPASTRYHLSRPGGLAEHSWNVYECLKDICFRYGLEESEDSISICGLLHDICKINFYIPEIKRSRVDGVWMDKKGYGVKDELPLGHGEKSVIVIQRHIELTPSEMMAIRWHMGPWEECNRKDLGAALNKSKLVKALQIADLTATWLVE